MALIIVDKEKRIKQRLDSTELSFKISKNNNRREMNKRMMFKKRQSHGKAVVTRFLMVSERKAS